MGLHSAGSYSSRHIYEMKPFLTFVFPSPRPPPWGAFSISIIRIGFLLRTAESTMWYRTTSGMAQKITFPRLCWSGLVDNMTFKQCVTRSRRNNNSAVLYLTQDSIAASASYLFTAHALFPALSHVFPMLSRARLANFIPVPTTQLPQ